MKDELGGNIVKKFVGLKVNTQNYLRDDNNEKKTKGAKKCVTNNKIIYLNNNKIDVKSLLENHKKFVENKITLTPQQRL